MTLKNFRVFAELQQIEPKDFQTNDIQNFLKWINEFPISGIYPSKDPLRYKNILWLSTIEHGLVNNPAELIETPRLSRKIPAVLSIQEIDELISAINLSTTEGTRNKAILEMLYGCGLRVSELCNLKISNLFLDVEFIKVEGKGNKERLIPIGQQAIKYLKIYLEEIRVHQTIKAGKEDFVFLNRRGSPLSRVMIFLIIKDLAVKIGLEKEISPIPSDIALLHT
ncbi:Tyrosine recombinase XerD [Sphingobacterium daejeonense]|nr:Tyrosine recombinase XerD [Sphingobacterium daejeonense]